MLAYNLSLISEKKNCFQYCDTCVFSFLWSPTLTACPVTVVLLSALFALVKLGIFPVEIWVAFPKESQLRQSCSALTNLLDIPNFAENNFGGISTEICQDVFQLLWVDDDAR